MATYKAILHHRTKKDGTSCVMIRITKDRKVSYISSGYYVTKKDWNEDKGLVRNSCSMHAVFNAGIQKMIRDAQTLETNSHLANKIISSNAIKLRIKNKVIGNEIKFFVDNHLADNAAQWSARTARRYEDHMKTLYRFFGENVTFEQITERDVTDFINSLFEPDDNGKPKYAANTIQRFVKTIRMFYTIANKKEFIDCKDPFKSVKIKSTKPLKVRLNMEEIEKLQKLSDLPTDLDQARDIFLFQFYSGGTRISDILMLRKKDIVDGRIEIITGKTKKIRSRLLVDQAKAILEKYITPKLKPDDTVFQYMRNVVNTGDLRFVKKLESATTIINRHLKTIAEKAEITKHITTHISRHSFADKLRQDGVDMYVISKSMDHSKLSTTEIYMEQYDQKSVDDAMKGVFDKSK